MNIPDVIGQLPVDVKIPHSYSVNIDNSVTRTSKDTYNTDNSYHDTRRYQINNSHRDNRTSNSLTTNSDNSTKYEAIDNSVSVDFDVGINLFKGLGGPSKPSIGWR